MDKLTDQLSYQVNDLLANQTDWLTKLPTKLSAIKRQARSKITDTYSENLLNSIKKLNERFYVLHNSRIRFLVTEIYIEDDKPSGLMISLWL